jgi:hypothetical protein
LAAKTRAEALRDLAGRGLGDLVALTRSCGKSRRPKAQPHCGVCSQCIDRRFATAHAGLEELDPAERYGTDLFTAELPQGKPKTLALNYVRFAQRTSPLAKDDLFVEFPELEGALDPDGPHFGAQARALAGVLARHAEETLDVVGRMVQRHAEALARPEPGYTLLRLAVASQARPVPDDEGADRVVAGDGTASVGDGPNTLRRTATGWRVRFGDETGDVKDSAGFRRLIRLMRAPGQEITAVELYKGPTVVIEDADEVYEPDVPSPDDRTQAGADDEDPDAILDKPYIKALRNEASKIRGQLREATDADRVALRARLEWINDELRKNVGPGGNPRTFHSADENARTGVANSISDCYEHLADVMPRLHAHLKEWVRTGKYCRYDPEPRERWVVLPESPRH